jgi:transposase
MTQTCIKRQHAPSFKAQVAKEAIKSEKTIAEIASEFSIHTTQVKIWKEQALKFLEVSFSGQSYAQALKQKDDLIEKLYSQIGETRFQLDWLKKKMGIASS